MENQKVLMKQILNTLLEAEYWMRQTILNLWQENRSFSMIIQRQIMMY